MQEEKVMNKAYKFRIYPSETTQKKLNDHLELCRWLYNRLLEELNKARVEGRKLTQRGTQAFIVKLKEENSGLKQVYAKVLQMVNYQLWSNIKALARRKKNGKKVGRLRFKGSGWFKTLNYNQLGFKIEDGKLLLSKIGEIPIEQHREIRGKVKGIIIKRAGTGKWYAIFQAENEQQPLPKTERKIGIDVGIKHFLTDTEGRQIENPEFYQKTLEQIQIKQKEVSRKRKGSCNRKKAKTRLARIHEKLVNQRNDFLHKLSRFYVNNYDVIATESLNIASMAKNRILASRILDASWSKFLQMLFYKAANADRIFVKVNPRGTSRESKEIKDRDYRASLNILKRGLLGLGQSLEPVETEPLRELCRVPASSIIEAGSPLR